MDVYSKWQEQKVEQQKVGKEGADGTMKQLNIYTSVTSSLVQYAYVTVYDIIPSIFPYVCYLYSLCNGRPVKLVCKQL